MKSQKMNFVSSIVLMVCFLFAVLTSVAVEAQSDGIAPSEEMSAPATTLAGSGVMKKFVFATENISTNTTSMTYIPVPSMTVTFTTKAAQPLLIHYCASSFAFGPDSTMWAVARVDGLDAAPGETQLEGHSTQFAEVRCFTWIANNVPQGTHTVEMFYKSQFGTTVFQHERTLTVFYKK
jgi:Cu/Ag efflux protein CusF